MTAMKQDDINLSAFVIGFSLVLTAVWLEWGWHLAMLIFGGVIGGWPMLSQFRPKR
jgi:hypothetical protein